MKKWTVSSYEMQYHGETSQFGPSCPTFVMMLVTDIISLQSHIACTGPAQETVYKLVDRSLVLKGVNARKNARNSCHGSEFIDGDEFFKPFCSMHDFYLKQSWTCTKMAMLETHRTRSGRWSSKNLASR
jgi:hypothetical protein